MDVISLWWCMDPGLVLVSILKDFIPKILGFFPKNSFHPEAWNFLVGKFQWTSREKPALATVTGRSSIHATSERVSAKVFLHKSSISRCSKSSRNVNPCDSVSMCPKCENITESTGVLPKGCMVPVLWIFFLAGHDAWNGILRLDFEWSQSPSTNEKYFGGPNIEWPTYFSADDMANAPETASQNKAWFVGSYV